MKSFYVCLVVIFDVTSLSDAMKVLVQNLQKRDNLATELFKQYDPDVMLLQEININSEKLNFPAHYVSRMGYGTAIGSKKLQVTNIKQIQAPYAEFGGFIRKKTTVATVDGIQFISFHGYNGQPFKNKDKLVAHVDAVLAQISTSGPALFAGDFNTWSKKHLQAVSSRLQQSGFRLIYSWPYPGRDVPLDHAFVRGLNVKDSQSFTCASDHRGAILDIVKIASL
ncbi:UPF0294 protein VIBHAR_03217-like [Clytia hemisphaerica]|uniref:UPF0294 protein VIBHAR_03217-like n=1 Tax=Clytia hemisphaerica TaxID=252671 RepID=UPI0034D5F959